LRDIMSPTEKIRRFSAALNAYPAGFSGNPLNLLLLDDAEPISAAEAYLRQLDEILSNVVDGDIGGDRWSLCE